MSCAQFMMDLICCILRICDQCQFRACKQINQPPEVWCLNRTLTTMQKKIVERVIFEERLIDFFFFSESLCVAGQSKGFASFKLRKKTYPSQFSVTILFLGVLLTFSKCRFVSSCSLYSQHLDTDVKSESRNFKLQKLKSLFVEADQSTKHLHVQCLL